MSSVEELFEAMRAWPEVEAIALGGSHATGNADEKSDYDVYLYVTAPVPTQRREKLLSDYCSRMEIDNNFWENEDNCTLNDGTDIDILYRDFDSFMNGVADVVEHFHASNGYTTCLWHNVITSTIVFDRNGRFAAAQRRFSVPFPEPLRRNIIERNTRLLHGNLPSYDAQIRKAANRGARSRENTRIPKRSMGTQTRRTCGAAVQRVAGTQSSGHRMETALHATRTTALFTHRTATGRGTGRRRLGGPTRTHRRQGKIPRLCGTDASSRRNQ